MNSKIILMFHQIDNSDWFERTIESIMKKYSLVSSDELYTSLRDEKKSGAYCNLSFDDGHKSFYKNVFPILQKLNIPATLFVSPLKISRRENFWFQQVRLFDKEKFHDFIVSKASPYFKEDIRSYSIHSILKSLKISAIDDLITEFIADNNEVETEYMNVSEDQLLVMQKSGLVEIGAHTQNHPILANEDEQVARKEIIDSITDLSKMIGSRIKYFAYPNGQREMDFGDREMKILSEVGINLAYSTEPGQINQSSPFYSMPRIGISKGSIRMTGFKIKHAKLWSVTKNVFLSRNEFKERKIITKILMHNTG